VPAVEVSGLVVRYGDLVAVDGLSFSASSGQVTALLGPNGAGKTTTVEVAVGLRRPDAGEARVTGTVGFMPQDGGVWPGARALEALRTVAAYHPSPGDPARLLERVGLVGRAGATWRQLSGGEQQRLSLAIALVGRPAVAFLDEPTAGVDVAGRQAVRQVVRDLRDEGVAVVLTTHDLDDAERLADHLVIVDRGRVVASGPPVEVLAGAEVRFGAPPGLTFDGLGIPVQEVAPGEYLAAVDPTPQAVAAITAWLAERDLPLGDLRAGRQRLEDVFLRLTGEEEA
jgi:ABC-2 type transport system ATP-binding protein